MNSAGKICFMCGSDDFRWIEVDQTSGITYCQCRDCGWEDIIVNCAIGGEDNE